VEVQLQSLHLLHLTFFGVFSNEQYSATVLCSTEFHQVAGYCCKIAGCEIYTPRLLPDRLPKARACVVQPFWVLCRICRLQAAFDLEALALLCCSKMQSTNVEAWTSTVETDIFQNGQVISKRMDVLLGSSLGSCKGATTHHNRLLLLRFRSCCYHVTSSCPKMDCQNGLPELSEGVKF